MNLKKILACMILLSFSTMQAQQNQYESSLYDAIIGMNLNFFMPVENSFTFVKKNDSEFFKYDYKLVAKSKEMESLIALHPIGKHPSTDHHPQIEFQRLLANIAPNDDDQEILVVGWDEHKLKKANADWGAEAYITPRSAITKFKHAKLIGLFKEGSGTVILIHCFDDPDMLPELFAFLPNESKGHGN